MIYSILFLVLTPFTVFGDKLSCASACQEALDGLTFDGTDPSADYYTASCTNILRAQSIYICSEYYCSSRDIKAGLDYLNSTCQQYGSVSMPPYSIVSNITDVAKLRQIGIEEEHLLDPIGTIVLPARELFDISLRTIDTWNYEWNTHKIYGYAMFSFWAVVLLIGIGNRSYEMITSKQQKGSMDSETQLEIPRDADRWTKLRLATKRYITIPPAIHYHCSQPVGWCTVPARIQSLTTLAFILINVVLCFVNYQIFSGNLYWSDSQTQLWRYIADRTGIIAVSNLPLLFTFAMRNNVLLWMTGWSFATFSEFHRWVARVATVEAIFHSVGYTVEAFLEGGKEEYYLDWAERYWWCGVIATIVMSFLCAASIYPLRRHFYDLFLLLHIVFAVIFLVVMWYHVEIFDGEFNGYIWPCVAVWVLDRVLRIARVVVLNYTSSSKSKAVATYNDETGVIRLSVPVSSLVQPQPGAHYYLYVFNGFKFWESHPFTLSSWEIAGATKADLSTCTSSNFAYDTSASKDEVVVDGVISSLGLSPPSAEPSISGDASHQTRLSFIIRPHDGFTSRLRRTVTLQRNCAHMKVLVEGPYGERHDLQPYQYILFIVGGSGITAALSYLCELATKETVQRDQSIELVWAVSRRGLFEDVLAHELEKWLQHFQGRLKLNIYITGQAGKSPTADLIEERAKEVNVSQSLAEVSKNGISIHSARPVVGDLVVDRAHDRTGGKMAILSCGPPQLADDVRLGVVHALVGGFHWVDYFPESFNW